MDHVMLLYGWLCAEMYRSGEGGEEMGKGWDVRYITYFYDMREGGAETLLLRGAECWSGDIIVARCCMFVVDLNPMQAGNPTIRAYFAFFTLPVAGGPCTPHAANQRRVWRGRLGDYWTPPKQEAEDISGNLIL
jgi:hypothetical protein